MLTQADLAPNNLIAAYSQGIFPMGDEHGHVHWYDADPRGILPFEAFHIPHDLKRILRQKRFDVTLDADFPAVIHACANRDEPTWITRDIIRAYIKLHECGFAHSVEAWQDGKLAGGLYGVAVGGAFFGESMFYRQRDASKIALAHLTIWLRDSGFILFDIQMVTDVLKRFGATHISKAQYLERLRAALKKSCVLRPEKIDWRSVRTS